MNIDGNEKDALAWAEHCADDIERLDRAARHAGWKRARFCDERARYHFGPVWLEVTNRGVWRAGVTVAYNYAVAFTAREALREAYYRCEDLSLREMIQPVYKAAGILG